MKSKSRQQLSNERDNYKWIISSIVFKIMSENQPENLNL